MVRASRSGTLALQVLIVLLLACERSKPEDESRYEAYPATMPAPPPEMTAAEPSANQHLDAAHKNFAEKHLTEAADEIRSAADHLKQDAEHAPGEARKEMRAAIDGLDRAERELRSGALDSAEKLDRHLAKAHASLARFHSLKATDAWVGNNQRAAGRDIVTAVDELEAATTRLGHKFDKEDETFARHARSVGQKLAEGARVAERDVGITLRGLDREIDELIRSSQ